MSLQSDHRLVWFSQNTVAKMSELVWEKKTILPLWKILVALSSLLSPVLKVVFEF